MVDKEKLILAYMKEYDMSRESAEKRAEQTIAKIESMYPSEETEDNEEDEEMFWDVSELMCCKCFERWIAVRPSITLLKDIECPRCKFTGAAIETGQEFYIEEDLEGTEGGENLEEE